MFLFPRTCIKGHPQARADFFLDEVRELTVAKQRKINDRVGPILVAIRNWNDVICRSRSEKVAEFA